MVNMVVVLCEGLHLMTLKLFSDLNDSMILWSLGVTLSKTTGEGYLWYGVTLCYCDAAVPHVKVEDEHFCSLLVLDGTVPY